MCKVRWGALIVSLLLWFSGTAAAEVAVPALKARVTDLTATLTAQQRDALESDLQGLESRNGAQIAVLLLPTTQPEAIEQYSIRVAEAWKIGQKGKDNGLILIVAKQDRKVRIEVGYGLEGVIPDVIAKRIIEENITPHFRQGDYYAGVNDGVQRLAGIIEGRTTAAAGVASAAPAGDGAEENHVAGNRLIDKLSEAPFWLMAILLIAAVALRSLLGPLVGGLAMGGFLGASVWFLSGALAFALIAGVLGFIFVLVGVSNWLLFALSSSSSSGGGSGGFSGGGGGFGGGGASGSW